jgi:EAL domain-containing protein (putative c-di-GMP-specific phosphodiesterase class I)/GGDEF domain-containing protein
MHIVAEAESTMERSACSVLEQILKGGHISPVYQPIVSLTDGRVYGYEALSRISDKRLQMDIEKMFRLADRMNKSWELEILCRTKALEHAAHMGLDTKLFLNVNSNIIYDDKFRNGFTKKRLWEYGLNSGNIIFEITERTAILDNMAFLRSVDHYKGQNYEIAIDDVGAGYSGLNLIAAVRPNLIKLDMNLIRAIDKDETKQLLCKAMIDFCKNAGIRLIAEGIETEEELKTVIRLGVDLGQGYFLGIPLESFREVAPEKIQMITRYHGKNYAEKMHSSVYPIIGHLAKLGHTFRPDVKVKSVYETLSLNPTITEFTVVENDVAVGLMTREVLAEAFGGQFGYSLHAKKDVRQLLKGDILKVNFNMPVDQVSRLAMQRPFSDLYTPIVVENENKYFGIVTVKSLLEACTKVEMDIALHSNPLTGLPGNLLIEKEIVSRLFGKHPYCITYYDIDNFKAYNDAYGFQNGDLMLTLIAGILKECAEKNEFVGHIGGDDFIVIGDYHEGEAYCRTVIDSFVRKVPSLYRREDVENGYIVSKNRHGVTENFPIASLSIAGISNKTNKYLSIEDFSNDIAKLKKKCKRQTGNYFEVL